MDKQSEYLQRVLDDYPALKVSSVRLLEDGYVNDVLVLNESLLFRFPRSADGVQRLAREISVLQAIQGRTTLAIPQPAFFGRNMQSVGHTFVGYAMIGGEPIRLHLTSIDSDLACSKVASQLGQFLRELHSSMSEVGNLGLPDYAEWRQAGIAEMFGQIQSRLYPLIREDARVFLTNAFDQFLGDPANFRCGVTLRHGDLNPNNVLYDVYHRCVTGIIDFGSTAIDDSAIDLALVAIWAGSSWGQRFVDRFLHEYGVDEPLLKRIGFYREFLPLIIAIEGLETGDDESVALGIARFR